MGFSWCPRCGTDLAAPSEGDKTWRCPRHGHTLPLTILARLDDPAIRHVCEHAEVPLWLPDPMPVGWTLAGMATVGDLPDGFRATVVSLRGPAPLGGTGEWLIVAEEPGIGLGASYAGTLMTAPPPGSTEVPSAKVHALGHPTPLWPVPDTLPDRSAYVGEAAGVWLWLVSFPADAGYAVLEDLAVTDLRSQQHLPPLETAELSLRLRPGH
jgi:hypothetical protein